MKTRRFALAVILALCIVIPDWAIADGPMTVTFIGVGQGDSAWVHTTDGEDMLIDGGIPSAGPTVVAYLVDHGVTHLDYVILSHPDNDHVGGLPIVLENMPVGAAWYNGTESGPAAYSNFLSILAQLGIQLTVVRRGDAFDIGCCTAVRVLHPAALSGDRNDDSVVMRITYGDIDVLFTGDAGATPEAEMLDSGEPLEAEILKVAHHGSAYSSSTPFLAAVQPQLAVISVGAGNQYGHPAPAPRASIAAATWRCVAPRRRRQEDSESFHSRTSPGWSQ